MVDSIKILNKCVEYAYEIKISVSQILGHEIRIWGWWNEPGFKQIYTVPIVGSSDITFARTGLT